MQTIQMIVFLISAVALPGAAIALMRVNMKAIGKGILFVVLAVVARYLLGALWVPEETGLLRLKVLLVASGFVAIYWAVCMSKSTIKSRENMPPWVLFASTLLCPLLVRLVYSGTFVSEFSGLFNSFVFWVCWTALALFSAAVLPKKMTMFGRVILAVAAVALLAFLLSGNPEVRTQAYVGKLNVYLRENIVDRWGALKKSTEKIAAGWAALVDLDRRAMAKGKIGRGKIIASAKINSQIAKLRKDLLPVDSRAVLARITKLDRKIESTKKSLSTLRERRGLEPARIEKLDARIAEAEANLTALENARAEAVATARQELKEIGLSLPENSPFLTVDLGSIIDNAIVAKNIGFIVENLKALVDADKGNAETAKRYYGAYIVMLDVQQECYRQYLNKAATGIWRDGITDVAKEAEVAMKANKAKAAAEGRSEEEKKAYLYAAATNEKIFKAAQVYLAILQRHEEVIRERLAATEMRHEIALSFWESVDIASAFGAKAISDMTDFEALLELQLPDIALFDDVAMQSEFDAITQKLMKE